MGNKDGLGKPWNRKPSTEEHIKYPVWGPTMQLEVIAQYFGNAHSFCIIASCARMHNAVLGAIGVNQTIHILIFLSVSLPGLWPDSPLSPSFSLGSVPLKTPSGALLWMDSVGSHCYG